MRGIRFCVLLAAVLLCWPAAALAHSGRTDSQGGHKDNNNVSGLGYYHYHHGYPPHLHPNGVCPYAAVSTDVPEPVTEPETTVTIKPEPTPEPTREPGILPEPETPVYALSEISDSSDVLALDESKTQPPDEPESKSGSGAGFAAGVVLTGIGTWGFFKVRKALKKR